MHKDNAIKKLYNMKVRVTMKPCISIIVPVYNVEKYLNRCLESLKNQSLRNIEIILVNDGSLDESGKICDEHSIRDKRIKVIHKENEGLGMARNTGLQVAQGEFVAYVDSDDYVSLDMYENLYTLAKKEEADTVLCNFYKVNSKGKILNNESDSIVDKVFYNEEVVDKVLINMLGANPSYISDIKISMSVWKGIYSNKLIKDNAIKFCSEREFISEDIIYHIDYLSYSRKLAITNKKHYYYCENNSSLTKSYNVNRFEKEKVLFEEIIRKVNEKKMLERAKLRIYRTFIGRFRTCIKHEVLYNKNILDSFKKISLICNDEKVSYVLNNYPIKQLPIKQRIFAFLVKYKMILGTYIVSKLNG